MAKTIKLLASDLDGTIIFNNQITKKDLEAVKKLKQNNVDFAICTGKTYAMTKDMCDIIMPAYGIFGNGTQIIDLRIGKEIIKNSLSNAQAKACIKLAQKQNLHIHLYTDNAIIAEKAMKYMAYRNFILYKNQMQFRIVESLETYIEEEKPTILKFVISGDKDLKYIETEIEESQNLTAIQIKKYGEYRDNIVGEDYEYLDIVPKNVTKYEALKQLCNYLKISLTETMAIGDNINDIDMIKHAGIGVAVGNSYKEVKKEAFYVTKNTVQTGAFAEAVDKFIINEQ